MDRDLAGARDLAIDLALSAGRLQVERRSAVVVTDTKAHANDLVSDVDLASERLIVEGISTEHPGDGILAEEGSAVPGTSGWRWVIDPLDGTRNYLTGTGPWSVCIALQGDGVTHVAVVHDPVSGEVFSAVAGAGARLDGAALAVSPATRVEEAIVGLSFDPSPGTKRRMVGLLTALLPAIGDVRRLPAALDLAYVAAGRLDAGLMVDTRLWDVAAGLLIAAEAGAVVGEVPGAGPAIILAATPAVRLDLVRLIETPA
jgi:myo-inositol-1(or 4)-monophosphatase